MVGIAFIGVGLIIDKQLDKAKAIAENFKYQIVHYGKILNANHYYLTRTTAIIFLLVDQNCKTRSS
jgi:alpha,alpha-trehalase